MVCRDSRIVISGRNKAYMKSKAVLLVEESLNFHAAFQEE